MTGQETEELHERIRSVVDERQDAFVSGLCTLLRFATVSGSLRPEREASFRRARAAAWRHLRHEAERLGLSYRSHEDEAVAIEWEGSDPDAATVGIAMHVDVVPTEEDWQWPPFAGAVVDGEVWGRGAQDDKGPIAMALASIETLQRLGHRPQGSVVLLIGSREETLDWPDVDLLLEREGVPDRVLVPDGAFPIGIGEKGIVTVRWQARWETDETEGPLRFQRLEGGTRPNVVPHEARLVFTTPPDALAAAESLLERLCLRVAGAAPLSASELVPVGDEGDEGRMHLGVLFHGRAAHAAVPKDGHNALLDALGFLTLVPEAGADAARFAGFLYEHTGALDATRLGLARSHGRLGDTTLNLGRAVLERDGGEAFLNVRFPLGVTSGDVHRACEKAASTASLPMRAELVGRPQEAFLCDPDADPSLFQALRTAYRTVTGAEPSELTIAGTTYAKAFDGAVGFGPVDVTRGEPVLVHQADERVSVERFLENIRIYALVLALLTREGPMR